MKSLPQRMFIRLKIRAGSHCRFLADSSDVHGFLCGRDTLLVFDRWNLLSFYDWYCDLPPSSPQVWGEQTDVPESADWYNSNFFIVVGGRTFLRPERQMRISTVRRVIKGLKVLLLHLIFPRHQNLLISGWHLSKEPTPL